MWATESVLTKLPQLDCSKNFVEETMIVFTIWKLLCDNFHNVVKYNKNFPHCGNYNVDFPLRRKV